MQVGHRNRLHMPCSAQGVSERDGSPASFLHEWEVPLPACEVSFMTAMSGGG